MAAGEGTARGAATGHATFYFEHSPGSAETSPRLCFSRSPIPLRKRSVSWQLIPLIHVLKKIKIGKNIPKGQVHPGRPKALGPVYRGGGRAGL